MKGADLFCGCGGMSAGFTAAGVNVAIALDCWEAALKVHARNLPGHPVAVADLSDVDRTVELLRPIAPDVIFGGPPCQDFSTSTSNRVEGERAGLTLAYATTVVRLSPPWFVMENVPAALTSETFGKARAIFEDAGYTLAVMKLNASYYGCPQARNRLIVVGNRLGIPADVVLETVQSRATELPTTPRTFLDHDEWAPYDHYWVAPRNYRTRGVYSMDEPCCTVRGMYFNVPPGYTWHPGDTCKDKKRIKLLNSSELGRLQAFPRSWQWESDKLTKTAVRKMIGNAVPVGLAKAVASAILELNSNTSLHHSPPSRESENPDNKS